MEGLVTDVAFVILLASVRKSMVFVVAFLVETFATVFARVRFVAWKCCFDGK